MPRFFVPFALHVGASYPLPETVQRHIKVLRLRADEAITLFNGDGHDYAAQVTVADKKTAIATVVGVSTPVRESPLQVVLAQAVSSGERMDFTLQKSVELGVSQIQPVLSERCVVRLAGERADKRVQRWQEIVIAACEQCGRNVVPPVLPLIGLNPFLQRLPESEAYFLLSIAQSQGLRTLSVAPKRLCLLAGPEGGFSEQEQAQAVAVGFEPLTLGPRVLRTETAALTALAAMQTLWGDF